MASCLQGGGYAHAVCVDADGDGAGTNIANTCAIPGLDCDDAAAGVNPAAPEDGTDWVDEDCDASPLTRRAFLVGFEPAYTTDWNTIGSVSTVPGGKIRIQPTSTSGAGIELKRDFTWSKGLVTVNVRFAQAPTTACSVIVAGSTASAMESLGSPSGAETVSVTFPVVLPGDAITEVKLSCTGAGTAVFDWLTIENGPYVWAPLTDIGVSFSTMGIPGAGHGTFVRMSEDAVFENAIRFTGGDVGGVAWSPDGYAWYTANGTQDDLNTQALGGVWDAWSPGEIGGQYFTAILVGNRVEGENGGLYYTEDITDPLQSWTRVPGPSGAPSYEGGIGATKWYKECGDNIASSGKLLVEDYLHDGLVLVGSTTSAPYGGVWAWDPNSPGTAPFEAVDMSFLPTDADPYISALAVVGDHLILGYRPSCGGDPAGAGHETALWDCEDVAGASAGPLTCVPIVDDTTGLAPMDVRDIEVTGPDNEGKVTIFVADGGRVWDGTNALVGESTVYQVTITAAGAYTVEDTDTATSLPTWAVYGDGSPAAAYRGNYYAGVCGQGSGGTLGDLVAPEADTSLAEGRELSSILLTQDGTSLFAFYPQASSDRDYGCVRVFRAVLGGTLPLEWTPFQGWEAGEMAWTSTSHPLSRRFSVELNGDAVGDEPLLETWGLSATYDAAWEPPVGGASSPSLLTSGLLNWRVFASNGLTAGWDTPWPADPYSDVLDQVEIELAWDGESESFMNSQGRDLSVYHGALTPGESGYTDVLIGGGNGDWKMAILHGRDATGVREAADRPPQVSKWTGLVNASAIWQDPAADPTELPELWMGMTYSGEDTSFLRGLIHADDVTTLEDVSTWCFDTFAPPQSGISAVNYLLDLYPLDTIYELTCQDSNLLGTCEPWLTCDRDITNGVSFDMHTADIGNMVEIVAVERDYAITAASPATLPSGGVGGGGLWVLHHDGIDGIAYNHVAFPSSMSCTEPNAFEENNEFNLHLDEEELVDAAGSGDVVLYYASRYNADEGGACGGAWKVAFNFKDAAPSATWTAISPSTTTCPFVPNEILGARPTRDGRFVYLWGGDPNSDAATGGVCRVDMTGATPAEAVIPSTPYLRVWDVLPHPHLDDVIWIGASGPEKITADTEANGGEGGVYMAQRRFRPGTTPTNGTWTWGSMKFGYFDLEERRIAELAWGGGWGEYPGADAADPRDDQMTNLYLAAYGGGWWDGALVLE